jgi:hypothetical protein
MIVHKSHLRDESSVCDLCKRYPNAQQIFMPNCKTNVSHAKIRNEPICTTLDRATGFRFPRKLADNELSSINSQSCAFPWSCPQHCGHAGAPAQLAVSSCGRTGRLLQTPPRLLTEALGRLSRRNLLHSWSNRFLWP